MPANPGERKFLSDVSTHLSIILGARNQDHQVRNPALQRFFDRYQLPIEAEIRAFSPWAARELEDLVSAFKTGLLTKDRLGGFDPEKGRFRDWMKTCLKNFLKDAFRRRFAARRDVRLEAGSTDEVDEDGNRLIDLEARSERQGSAFDRAWAKQVVRFAIEALEKEMATTRREAVFRELKPVFSGVDHGLPYAEIAKRLGMTEANVKVSVYRMRKRLGELIRLEVRESLGSKVDVDDEIRLLMSLLAKAPQ